jgi:hypothetical protein
MSRMVSVRVIGTPEAVVPFPRLDRMSLRTIPDCSSTFTPLEPSPGYGPAVSSGISPADVDPEVAVDEGLSSGWTMWDWMTTTGT